MPEPSLELALLAEICIFAVALFAARWGLWQMTAAKIEQKAASFSDRPVLSFAALALASVGLRLGLLLVNPVPIPLYHDEFSYLLGADTFAHGRLTNPTPPASLALETIHTNMWPTYQSMYMPGPSLLLTFGQLLGLPWLSVLLVDALFVGAVYWMISGWLPRGYAFTMALVALGISGSLSWWFDNYFCVGLSALAGALVLGSLPRIASTLHWRSTGPLTLGLLSLMLTRPYEGCCVALPCVLVLLWNLRAAGWMKLLTLAILPVAVLGLTFAWLLFYNWRGTGHLLLFPYMLNFQQYHITGPFLFSAKKAIPTYHWDILRRFYGFAELPQYEFMRFHPWEFLAKKIAVYYFAYCFGFGLLLVPGVVHLVRHRRNGLALAPVMAFCGFVFNVVLMAWAPFPQYAAPAASLFLLLVAYTLFWMRQDSAPRWSGVRLVRGVALAELMLGFSLFGLRLSESGDLPEPRYVSQDRARVTEVVLSTPGKQLCLVRYAPGHDGWQEWVFNNADPENERLVWARSGDATMDRQTIQAYPSRQVWLVTPDNPNRLVAPYPFPDPSSPK